MIVDFWLALFETKNQLFLMCEYVRKNVKCNNVKCLAPQSIENVANKTTYTFIKTDKKGCEQKTTAMM